MNKKPKLLAVSLVLNAIFIIAGIVFFVKGYHVRIIKPYLWNYYLDKVSLFQDLKDTRGMVVFLGDSLTDRCEWSELFNRRDMLNRGIDADTSEGVLNRIDDIIALKPKKIFIMIGGNDLNIGKKVPEIEANYKNIIANIRAGSPLTKIYIQSLLPTVYKLAPLPRSGIKELNARIRAMADNVHVLYVDIYSQVIDANGDLNSEYTRDGVHLNGKGYRAWRRSIDRFIK